MANYTAGFVSEAANGIGVLIIATSSAGTLIHTNASGIDEIVLLATNNHTVSVNLTIEWGGATMPITIPIPSKQGLTLVIPKLRISGGLSIRAFASITNVVTVYVNKDNVL